MPRRTAPRPTLPMLLAPAALAALLAGCGTPPAVAPITPAPGVEQATPTPTISPAPTFPPPAAGAPAVPSAPGPAVPGAPAVPGGQPSGAPAPTPSRTGPPARDCAGKPDAQTLLALLRGPRGVLGPDTAVTVTSGPLCAAGWQFTVLSAPGHGSLQVITRGEPDALRVVTAGTDLCTPQIRAEAPPGIAALACDGATADEGDA